MLDNIISLCNYFGMLAKKFRLKKSSAFQATYRVKNSFSKSGIILFAGKTKNNTQKDFPTKVGFVVSKKAHKRAVKRNRLKRLMRESYRLLLKNNKTGQTQNHLSLIFVGLDKAIEKDYHEVLNAVSFLVEKVK